MADDDHLLVVAAEREHPLVQQHLSARPVDGEGEHPVRTDLRSHHVGVRVPQQPAHLAPRLAAPDSASTTVGPPSARSSSASPRHPTNWTESPSPAAASALAKAS